MLAARVNKNNNLSKAQTTNNLLSRLLQEQAIQQSIKKYLHKFHIEQELNEFILKSYIKQFHIHSAKDLNTESDIYVDIATQLVNASKARNNFFNYILGFEIIKIIFKMSWLQHERLYELQKHQEHFLKTYIRPIQKAHRLNGIVVPKHENIFFAKRSYFIKKPNIKEKKLIELVMVTFPKETVINLGFLAIHHPNFLVFDYEYIFKPEPEYIFTV